MKRGAYLSLLGTLTLTSLALATDAQDMPQATQTAEAVQAATQMNENAFGLAPWALGLIVLIGLIAVVVPILLVMHGRKQGESSSSAPEKTAIDAATQEKRTTIQVPIPLPIPLVGNVRHIGGRESQQDAFGVSALDDADIIASKGVLAVVADGMGGLENGNQISNFVVTQMLKLFQTVVAADDPELLLRLMLAVNNEVNKRFGGDRKTGTTLIAALLHHGKLHFLSIGDSRIALIRGGSIIQLNRQHTYGAELDEQAGKGLIGFNEARGNAKRVAVTSFLGMGVLEKVDRNVEPLELLPGDKVILMTDGVFNTLDDHTIAELLSPGAVKGAENLGNAVLACERLQQDNFTAIVLEV